MPSIFWTSLREASNRSPSGKVWRRHISLCGEPTIGPVKRTDVRALAGPVSSKTAGSWQASTGMTSIASANRTEESLPFEECARGNCGLQGWMAEALPISLRPRGLAPCRSESSLPAHPMPSGLARGEHQSGVTFRSGVRPARKPETACRRDYLSGILAPESAARHSQPCSRPHKPRSTSPLSPC